MTKNQNNITHINLAKGFRGGERQTLLLIQELSCANYIQTVVTRKDAPLADKLFELKLKNVSIVQITKPYFLHVKTLKNSFLIHAHETKAAQLAYLSNLLYKTPYIITRRVALPVKDNIFTQNMYKKAATIVALSNAVKQTITDVDKNIDVHIIPSAYSDLQVNKQILKQIKDRFKNKFLIGNIGELDNSTKGQHYLIEAAKNLQKMHPDIHFIFLGKGKDKERFQLQAKGLTNITFEGFVSNVGDYIAALDLFVFPSLHEGLGSILFDVMQAKVPIIATDVGGIPDIINDRINGILIPPKDAAAIQKAICDLYTQKEKQNNLAINAHKKIEEFSPQKMAQKYIKLYTNITKNENEK